MNEKDSIKDLFSNAFEQHTSAVRPEVWQGLQSKMAAAGITASGATAVKGISALTKWIIGGAAVAGTTIVATVLLSSNEETQPAKQTIAQTESTSLQTKESEGSASPAVPSQMEQKYQTPTETTLNEEAATDLSGLQQPQSSAFVYTPILQGTTTPSEKISTPSTIPPVAEPVEAKPHTIATDAGNASASESQKPLARLTRVPNAFTPNYDGDNDVFFVESENMVDFSVMIIQAATQKVVYTSSNPEFRWDGTDQTGNALPAGQYRCVIIGSGSDQKVVRTIETVTLVR